MTALLIALSLSAGEPELVDVAKLDALCYLHSKYFSCGKELGVHGFTKQ